MNYSGRKYRLSLIALSVMLGGFMIVPFNTVLQSAYSELITGVIGVLVLYFGGNNASKYIATKYGEIVDPPQDKEEKEV